MNTMCRPVFLLLLFHAAALFAAEIEVDCAKSIGTLRALNGLNNGPLPAGGLLDLSSYYREIGPPLVRLHDSHWPTPDVVDIHVVFPNFGADPSKIESYDFGRTDEYIASIQAVGAKVVYRLGESIEHTKEKYHVHPPRDPAKWAHICVGIVRHFNEGWGAKSPQPIGYWEIWNEPENRPAMWTGSDEEYFQLYAAASKAIKQRFPSVKVGGPAIGYPGDLKAGQLQPTPFLSAFLTRCREQHLPLDFFSWHTYSDDPTHPAALARAIRKVLDDAGFAKAESHLNEWNYLPDNDWGPIMLQGQGEKRQRFYERMAGPEAAAFVAAALIALQDAPLDAANFYTGDANPFGLFTEHGVPKKTFYAFKAFHLLLQTPERISAKASTGIFACAGRSDAAVTLLVASPSKSERMLTTAWRNIPWANARCEVFVLDSGHSLAATSEAALHDDQITIALHSPALCLIRLKKPASAK
jgi:xylan 1,4-beta-xylosidase